MAIWQTIQSNKQVRQANNFSKSVDTQNNAFFIDANAYSAGYGWDFDKFPVLATRKGRTTQGASGGARSHLITTFKDSHLIRIVGTKIQRYTNSGWVDIGTSTVESDWDCTHFDINGPALILVNGIQQDSKYWDGTTLHSMPDTMPGGKYIASDNRRVYISRADNIHYCAFQNALDWTTAENSGIVQYYTPNGGEITGLKAFEGQIWVFKRDSYALIFHTGDARITHRLVEGSNDIGCDNWKTIVEVGPYLFFKGPNDVYMGAGGAARAIGEPIRKILDSVNPAPLYANCAWTDGNRYYLCLATGTNTVPDTEVVFDIRYKQWHVRNINLGGMVCGGEFLGEPYGGWADGQTYKLNSGTTDAGTPIPWRVDSRPYDEGVKEAEKEYYQMHIQGYVEPSASMTVKISTDDRGESFSTLDTISSGTVTQNKNIIVPMDTVPITHWMRYRLEGTGPVEIDEVQRYARVQPVQE